MASRLFNQHLLYWSLAYAAHNRLLFYFGSILCLQFLVCYVFFVEPDSFIARAHLSDHSATNTNTIAGVEQRKRNIT
jgi:hypothetical protein